jgi:hypothetical protein
VKRLQTPSVSMSDEKGKWHRRFLITGAFLVLGFWMLAPLVATRFGYSSIDVSFWITALYALVFLAWKARNRLKEKLE